MPRVEPGACPVSSPTLVAPRAFWRRVLIAALLAVFCVEVVRTAWISDDAAITLRTVLNWLYGYGPRFNVDERVQAYTHPLWFLTLAGLSWLRGNVFDATFVASIGFSLLGFYLLCRLALHTTALLLAAALLILSRAYVDFATSGLENPLSHVLLLAAFSCAVGGSRRAWYLRGFFLACGLIYLCRPDQLLLVAPLAAWVSWQRRGEPRVLAASALLWGAIPILAWSVFSLYYYGFPFPNTAYAKLGTGIDLSARLVQGSAYFYHALATDPLTLFGIALGLVVARRQDGAARMLALGSVLYLGYIAWIGGDFMAGRFLTAPLLASAIIVVRSTWVPQVTWMVSAVLIGLGGLTLSDTLLSGKNYSDRTITPAGIANERGYYYQETGLLTIQKSLAMPAQWDAGSRRVVRVACGGLGFSSISTGPDVHWMDVCGLADPLLSRLPAAFDPNWRIGHFIRQIPTDYLASIERDANLLTDQRTKVFYDDIRRITRGRLDDPLRWKAIVHMNLGRVTKPDFDMYRFQAVERSSGKWWPTVSAKQVSQIAGVGAVSGAVGSVQFEQGIYVQFAHPVSVAALDVAVDHDDFYEVYARQGDHDELIAVMEPRASEGMARHVISIPPGLKPTDVLLIRAKGGDQKYSLGHLVVR